MHHPPEAFSIAHALEPKELVDFRELVTVNECENFPDYATLNFGDQQLDTMYQLLIQKRYFTKDEFLEKMKEVQTDYQRSGRH